jgi:hypothetical protein
MTSDKSERIENDVLAVIRSRSDAREAARDLEQQGFEPEGIRVFQSADEAEEKLDPFGERSGFLQKILKHYEGLHSDENRLLEEYTEAAKSGAGVIAVHVDRKEDVEKARDILLGHNAENIRHFGTWAVTDLEGQGRATS